MAPSIPISDIILQQRGQRSYLAHASSEADGVDMCCRARLSSLFSFAVLGGSLLPSQFVVQFLPLHSEG